MKKSPQLKPLILASIFASTTAICSIISIPLPFSPVPINLALLSVYLAGGLLGPKYGAASQFIYVLLGAVGLPVFHNLTGGLSILTGPTGGFIIGYVAAAFTVGLFYYGRQDPFQSSDINISFIPKNKNLIIGLITGLFFCYLLGTLWFVYISDTNLLSALLLCVVPFLPGDVFKILAAIFLIRKLRPIIGKIH